MQYIALRIILSYHITESCVKSEAFKRRVETPYLDIRDQLHPERIIIEHLNRNRLVPIIETILFLVRQELAFRGHRGESGELRIEEPNHNDGNFRSALRLLLKAGDTVLKNYLSSCGANAKYLSPLIQNETINITGYLMTQKIVTEVKKCGLFSILADESADVSVHEHLSISVRYATKNEGSCMLLGTILGFVTVFDLTVVQ